MLEEFVEMREKHVEDLCGDSNERSVFMLDNIKELIQQSKTNWKELYPDWDDSAMNCGPNKYIAGDEGDDFDAWNNLQIYYNREADVFYLDQVFYPDNTEELEIQLAKLLSRLHLYNEMKKEQD